MNQFLRSKNSLSQNISAQALREAIDRRETYLSGVFEILWLTDPELSKAQDKIQVDIESMVIKHFEVLDTRAAIIDFENMQHVIDLYKSDSHVRQSEIKELCRREFISKAMRVEDLRKKTQIYEASADRHIYFHNFISFGCAIVCSLSVLYFAFTLPPAIGKVFHRPYQSDTITDTVKPVYTK